jgi:hypothetical protein
LLLYALLRRREKPGQGIAMSVIRSHTEPVVRLIGQPTLVHGGPISSVGGGTAFVGVTLIGAVLAARAAGMRLAVRMIRRMSFAFMVCFVLLSEVPAPQEGGGLRGYAGPACVRSIVFIFC